MAKFHLMALLAISAASLPAPAYSIAPQIEPGVDSAEERQALRTLSACLAEARPRWARAVLAHPYLSVAQARAATEALKGRDSCIQRNDVEVTFRTSTMVGSLAEHFLKPELGRVDVDQLKVALAAIPAGNVTEDFALCVASRDPVAARELALSEPGGSVEMRAAQQLAQHVQPCTNRGEQLTVDLQALRALMATALYRGVTAHATAQR